MLRLFETGDVGNGFFFFWLVLVGVCCWWCLPFFVRYLYFFERKRLAPWRINRDNQLLRVALPNIISRQFTTRHLHFSCFRQNLFARFKEVEGYFSHVFLCCDSQRIVVVQACIAPIYGHNPTLTLAEGEQHPTLLNGSEGITIAFLNLWHKLGQV